MIMVNGEGAATQQLQSLRALILWHFINHLLTYLLTYNGGFSEFE